MNPSSPNTAEKKRQGSLFGPGLIIAASFIGPGTITTAIVTGADYGFTLAWSVVFSIIATLVLQEMAVRLGIGAGLGLGEAIRRALDNPILRTLMIILVVAAIGIGGAAYAGGDTTGTSLAVSAVAPIDMRIIVALIVVAIFSLLITGSYKTIERVLMVMVGILTILFVITAFVVQPPVGEIFKGIFAPSMPPGSALTAIALIGTTVVPYNVFLHASLVQENWEGVPKTQAMKEARLDTAASISLGGLITLAVMATSFGALFLHGMSAETAEDLSTSLQPLLGDASTWVFALGLFAAGFTSALAGPLGAAYAITGILGKSTDMKSPLFRGIWISVLAVGAIIALTGIEPIQLIVIAQAANGLLLPIIAIFLLVTMNSKKVVGDNANGLWANVFGGAITLVVIGLGCYQLADLLGLLPS
ncbi:MULTISPECIES: Nramp family divalent metal transporter [unclassified Brevibacterium]|uniref:Nramp family divalent metal transporter n=1 Tax=unclassified Brevibacterium TaxID=2614124 RepID=UPI0008A308DC|nr:MULTISPECIES: Nramp family divalent metal transporter [unclassified Brevibacterium]OFL64253.1 manganese transporter [Brevibacterium sp. HMSC063G07]